ncbi:MAG: hypothetical protein JW803_05330 [Endomicrobiales bacterium]|nr:hypothetical protein [Endomicrobiales bacterium]
MALSLALAFMVCGVSSAGNVGKPIYGIYTDTYEGMKIGEPNLSDADRAYLGTWGGPTTTYNWRFASVYSDTTTYTEGGQSLMVRTSSGAMGGFYVMFGTAPVTDVRVVNCTYYTEGTLQFDIKLQTYTIKTSQVYVTTTTVADVVLKIEWFKTLSASLQGAATTSLTTYLTNYTTGWRHVSIPLNDIVDWDGGLITPYYYSSGALSPTDTGLAVASIPFGLFAPATKQFWIDNVFYTSVAPSTYTFTIKRISDNIVMSSITWSNVIPGATKWKAADQYIEIDFNYYHSGWGINVYTDNKGTGADPGYTWTNDPAGLVNTSTTTKVLPMCWRVVDVSTDTLSIQQGATELPNQLWVTEFGDQYPCFLWIMDRNTSGFSDTMDYITVWEEKRGIQHAESTWGAAKSKNYIYFGANFENAVAPATYRTNKLTLELYYE